MNISKSQAAAEEVIADESGGLLPRTDPPLTKGKVDQKIKEVALQMSRDVDKAMGYLTSDRNRSLAVLISISVMCVVVGMTSNMERYQPSAVKLGSSAGAALKKASMADLFDFEHNPDPIPSSATTSTHTAAVATAVAQPSPPTFRDTGLTREELQAIGKHYADSRRESYRFFNNISNTDWQRMKQGVKSHANHQFHNDPSFHQNVPRKWYKHNFDPNFSCLHEQRVSNFNGRGDGGKWVCDPHRIGDHVKRRMKAGLNGCRIYSVDYTLVKDDYRRNRLQMKTAKFESAIEQAIGGGTECEIHVFDPFWEEDGVDFHRKEASNLYFHPWGLKGSGETDTTGRQGVYKTFQETMELLDHRGVIDILSLDCAGCEWTTFQDWLDAPINIGQVLVEVHGSPQDYAIPFFEAMQEKGYVTFHKENSLSKDGCCYEYSFLRMRRTFFDDVPNE